MKINSYLLQVSVISLAAGNKVYPDYGLKGMMGFAKKGNTTGGHGGKVIYILNLKALKTNVRGKTPLILVITKNIGAPKPVFINLGPNKSIIGSWHANVLKNVNFKTDQSTFNIILQNLIFEHDIKHIKNQDTQISITHGKRFWIDHCTIDGRKINLKDEGKMIRVNGKVDYVTISNCKFINRRFGLIFGQVPQKKKEVKQFINFPRVSVMFNYYDNIRGRAPALTRLGYFHFVNNYVNNFHLGFTLHLKAKIFSERNYFSEQRGGNEFNKDDGTSHFTDVGSVNLVQKPKSGATSWNPSSNYTYKSMPAEQAKEFCMKYSGAQCANLVFGGT